MVQNASNAEKKSASLNFGIIADALYLDAGALDLDANLVELGVDSILAVEIARKLQDGFGIALPATRLYDAPTIRRLAALVADSDAPAAPAPASVAPAPTDTPSPVPVAKGAAVVPDEVLRRLSVLLAEALYLAPEQIDPEVAALFEGVDARRGDSLVVFGWAMAEDLAKLA